MESLRDGEVLELFELVVRRASRQM